MDQDHTTLVLFALLIAGVGYLLTTRSGVLLVRFAQRALGLGLVAMLGLGTLVMWDEIETMMTPKQAVFTGEGKIVLPRERDGHYYLTAEVNGAPVRFTIDTGASGIVLTQADARAAGITPDDLAFIGRAFTANGEVRTAPVRLESFVVGPVRDENLRAYVNEGAMDGSLLGMSYLQRYSKIEITEGALTLTR